MRELSQEKTKILVLDCDHKNALAIVRHLGRTGKYKIDGVSYGRASIAFYSKFIEGKYVLNNPQSHPDKYIAGLLSLLKQNHYAVLIPVSYISYQLCAVHQNTIRQFTHLTIASKEHIYLAGNKIGTYKLADELGIPYPQITEISQTDQLSSLNVQFPCVIKGPFEAGKNMVAYVDKQADLIEKYRELCSKHNFGDAMPFIQKFIQGDGAGFFAFYKNGILKNYFIHRRIREYPVKGGASTVAEGFHNDEIFQSGKKLLDHLQWEGVAMVEFKKDNETGHYNLMEINAKFWGSLDLALVSGVNFPEMLIDDALGKEITPLPEFKKTRFQWVLNGDLFHVIERPWKIPFFFKDLLVAKNDFYFSDILPNLFQLANIPVHYYKKWFK